MPVFSNLLYGTLAPHSYHVVSEPILATARQEIFDSAGINEICPLSLHLAANDEFDSLWKEIF